MSTEYPKCTGHIQRAQSSGTVIGFISSEAGEEYLLTEQDLYESINHYEGPKQQIYIRAFNKVRAYNIEHEIDPLYPHITYPDPELPTEEPTP